VKKWNVQIVGILKLNYMVMGSGGDSEAKKSSVNFKSSTAQVQSKITTVV